mmetsp:Transcript_13489/g.22532  ORF Transcript_13489/g.22532 Transcript_13489/m.22532 type:complete len:120 (+) Transcript_13489:3856-4215(+)
MRTHTHTHTHTHHKQYDIFMYLYVSSFSTNGSICIDFINIICNPQVEDQNYQIMLKLINDGCLRDSFSLKMEIRLADILRVLVSCAICEKAAMQRLWDATNAANLVEKHLVDFVSASWK